MLFIPCPAALIQQDAGAPKASSPTQPSRAQAPSSSPAKVDPRASVPVGAEVKVIEEASLLSDGMLATETGSTKDTAVRKTKSSITGEDIITGMPDMDADSANALRVYGFTLNPHEELNLRLKCDNNAIVMRVIKPPVIDAMAPAIRKANFPPTSIRNSRLSVQNILDRPYTVNVLLYGKAGYKFRLDITRKP